jgi:hypothetical protein
LTTGVALDADLPGRQHGGIHRNEHDSGYEGESGNPQTSRLLSVVGSLVIDGVNGPRVDPIP